MKKLIQPPRLRKGDTIGIIAPASPPTTEKTLKHGIEYLEKQGFNVKIGNTVYERIGYLAGKDQARLNDLHNMFQDKNVKGIIAVRGGYGSGRLLPYIDFSLIEKNPKIFIGYSDITAFLLAIHKKTGMITYFGPMVAADFGGTLDERSEEIFWKMMTEENAEFTIPMEDQLTAFGKTESFSGTIVGGNLSIICSLIGTSFLPDFKNKILVLEEIGEPPYRIDRMLNQIKLCGFLSELRGIMLGQFTNCVAVNDRPTLSLKEIFTHYFKTSTYSVIGFVPFGHERNKITLPIGGQVVFDARSQRVRVIDTL